mmetsp:Transcript_131083/g.261555  ORF Transcript_131083/g.261555 Transcript_131083/m.261555 type:complete len:643 (+) Transcript_131083:121-2049(+)
MPNLLYLSALVPLSLILHGCGSKGPTPAPGPGPAPGPAPPIPGDWAFAPDMSIPRKDGKLVAFTSKGTELLFAIGGSKTSKFVETFDGDKWTTVNTAPLHADHIGAGVAVFQDKPTTKGGMPKIFLVGGGQPTKVEVFDGNLWMDGPPMEDCGGGCDKFDAVVIDTKLYAICAKGDSHGDVCVLDGSTGTPAWSAGTSTGYEAEGFTTAVLDGKIYVLGGSTDKDQYLKTVKVFDGKTWSSAPSMIKGRSNAAAAIYDKKLFLVGGVTSHGPGGSTVVEVFDGKDWHLAPSTQTVHGLVSAASFGSKLFIMGAQDKESSKVEVFNTHGPRIGSFLVIGDWGFDAHSHGANLRSPTCQHLVGDAMDQEMGKLSDVKFIVNVGDSFYPDGVSSKSDPQWDAKWRNFYSKQLQSVPWYSVMGNHDYHHDPAACSDKVSDGAQINGDIKDLSTFYMPDFNWHLEHPELQLEVVALDLNNYEGRINSAGSFFPDCQYTPCEKSCKDRVRKRSKDAFKFVKERIDQSTAKNLLIFSHYPVDHFQMRNVADESAHFLDTLIASKTHIEYFGGHRHNVDQTILGNSSIAPHNFWLSGGGGGWSCDGSSQGFVVGEIFKDGFIFTRSVIKSFTECCNMMSRNGSEDELVVV